MLLKYLAAVDGGTERGAEARSAVAPRGVGSGEGAVAPPQYGGLREKFSKINVHVVCRDCPNFSVTPYYLRKSYGQSYGLQIL